MGHIWEGMWWNKSPEFTHQPQLAWKFNVAPERTNPVSPHYKLHISAPSPKLSGHGQRTLIPSLCWSHFLTCTVGCSLSQRSPGTPTMMHVRPMLWSPPSPSDQSVHLTNRNHNLSYSISVPASNTSDDPTIAEEELTLSNLLVLYTMYMSSICTSSSRAWSVQICSEFEGYLVSSVHRTTLHLPSCFAWTPWRREDGCMLSLVTGSHDGQSEWLKRMSSSWIGWNSIGRFH
jgi:hypothetical protein